jgi:hypothetical protein
MMSKVLENVQRPKIIGAAIADENRFLDASHNFNRAERQPF